MTRSNNPQASQMADESMVRGLSAQARAIWPQEQELLAAYDLPEAPRILDLACGTGEISERLAALFPQATLLGVDIDAAHLEKAQGRCAAHGERMRWLEGDIYEVELPTAHFDLSVCRHILQAVPDPARVVERLVEATRPGGTVHLVAEDYAMMHFHPTRGDNDRFWLDGPVVFANRLGSDLRSGRTMFTILKRLGLENVRVDYVTIDPMRVPREVVAEIWIAWRDGFAEPISRETPFSAEEVHDQFESMIECIRDPEGYFIWHLPVVSGRRSHS